MRLRQFMTAPAGILDLGGPVHMTRPASPGSGVWTPGRPPREAGRFFGKSRRDRGTGNSRK